MKEFDPLDCPFYLISRATLVLTASFKKAFAAAGVGIVRPAYLGVLWCLWKEEGLKTIDLGRCAGLEPSTMTGLLDRMERDGFVRRSSDPGDRRVQVIHLTENGRKIQETVVRMVDETLALMFQGISDEDIARTNEVLRKVLANAREENN
jgi:DNA-binding MarR family transcriptional regulator